MDGTTDSSIRGTDSARTTGFYSDLLKVCGVRHTRPYSDRRFSTMPFMTMFGLKKLLEEYGVASTGVGIDGDADTLAEAAVQLPVPYVAPVRGGQWVIVTAVHPKTGTVEYLSQGVAETAGTGTFGKAWNGTALLVKADATSCEPHYMAHRFAAMMTHVRDAGIWICLFAVLGYFYAVNGLWESIPLTALVIFNALGIVVSYMLAQKTVGVHTRIADRVCSAIQEHGCDHVLKSGGTFMGIFHWSEVGLGYFTVSLAALLIGGESMLPWLALYNACCLPYTLWSVSYQKFKAHAWCTLCLTVQASLWILAGLYFWAGAWQMLREFEPAAVLLPLCYVGTVLALNKILSKFTPADNND